MRCRLRQEQATAAANAQPGGVSRHAHKRLRRGADARPPAPGGRIFARRSRGPEPRPDGLLLGRYTLLERLGAGGFGEVWRARDELLHREVALKRVHVGPSGNSERAAREALAAARLSHPAIVALYEACAAGEDFYLISELVDGDTLASLIRSDELDDEEILEIGLALTAAIAHAHARGVIHRDIKPHNVLVPHRVEDVAGAAKLTDFGGATLAGEEALTRTGDVLGTLAYMSPEQSEGREAARSPTCTRSRRRRPCQTAGSRWRTGRARCAWIASARCSS